MKFCYCPVIIFIEHGGLIKRQKALVEPGAQGLKITTHACISTCNKY